MKRSGQSKRKQSTTARKFDAGSLPVFEPVESRLLMSASFVQTKLADVPEALMSESSNVVADSAGNLYGTITNAGPNYDGVVYEVAAGSNTATVLASFDSAAGQYPEAGLTIDSNGNLYGTTAFGGANNGGTIFEIAAGTGTITTLAAFNPSVTGSNPEASLLLDSNGNLYGTNYSSGPGSSGTIFELPANSGAITVLASFNSTSGIYSNSALTMDANGNIYGTTSSDGANGDGTIFELPANTNTIVPLVSFSTPSGSQSNVIIDASGNLFGTLEDGGSHSDGSIFELPANSSTLTTLAEFNGTNGQGPQGSLVMDSAGNLFGATEQGGPTSAGTVFKLAAGSNTITTIASFDGSQNVGGYLLSGITTDSDGNLYGTTAGGGTNYSGVVFEVSPSTDVWSGADNNGDWTDGANWQGGVAPFSGESVDFPANNVQSPVEVDLNGNQIVGDLTIEGSYDITNGSSAHSLTVDGPISLNGSDAQIDSQLTLGGNTTVTVGASNTLTLGSVDDASNGFGITQQGAGTLAIDTGTYTGSTEIADGTLSVGTQLTSDVTVDTGATYDAGTASVGSIIGNGGTVNLSDAATATGSLTLGTGSTLEEQLAGTGNSISAGALTVSGQAIDLTGSALDIESQNGFAPSGNAVITLISNQTGSAITGTFNGLAEGAMTTVNGITYQVSYAGGQSHQDVTLTVIPTPTANHLAVVSQPASVDAGRSLGTVVVDIEDSNGNIFTSDNSTITLATSSTISGTTSVAAVNGVATFTGLSIDQAGNYILTATDGSLASATSNPFMIAAGPAVRLAVAQQPSASAAAGHSIGTVAFQVQDTFGNAVLNDNSNVSIVAQVNGAAAPAGALSGTATAAVQNGIASFSNLSLGTGGTYTLIATDSGLIPIVTSAVTVTGTTTTTPNTIIAGAAIPPVTVDVATAFPQATTPNKHLKVKVESNATGHPVVLSKSVRVKNGNAVVKNLKIHKAGVYNVIVADADGDTTTQQYTVVAKTPVALKFTTAPAVLNGTTPISVDVVDRYGNVSDADDGDTVTLRLGRLNGPRSLTGTLTGTFANGVATFSNVSATNIGDASLIATSATLIGRVTAVLS